MTVTSDPLVVTVTPIGGTERTLRLDGHPSYSRARGIGCEQASIPVAREELDAPDLQGAVLRIHGADWWGIIIERPEPGRPLSALGYGAWVGSLVKRAVLYADNRVDAWRSWQPQGGNGGDGITPAVKTWTGSGWYIGITKNVPVGAYANQGISYSDARTFTNVKFKWLKTKANTSYGCVVYSGNVDGTISRTEYTNTGTGATVSLPLPLDTVWVVIAAYNPSVAFTPTLGGEGIYVTDITVTGRDMTSVTLSAVFEDIMNAEIPAPYGLSGVAIYPFNTYPETTPATVLNPVMFDTTTPNEKLADLMRRLPIEYGWYGDRHYDPLFGHQCYPHLWDRPTAPAYVLSLDSLETPAELDYARLDEMTSGTNVVYTLQSGQTAELYVPDTDLTHPLVALGITRYGEVSGEAADATEAALIGQYANAENGRMRVRGSVTVRDELKTLSGADVDMTTVRPGEMVRLIGTRAGTADVRIHRLTTHGGVTVLELDGSGWRLDAYLASLDARR